MRGKLIFSLFIFMIVTLCIFFNFSGAFRDTPETETLSSSEVILASAPEPGRLSFASANDYALDEAQSAQAVSAEKAPETAAPSLEGSWTISFAGDCTIATLHEWQHSGCSNNMLSVIGSEYTYPFQNVSTFFRNDDLTLVNLEGTFTDSDEAKTKDYRFKAAPVYAKCLVDGGVDAVSLANNHSSDYLEAGLADTQSTLDSLGIGWAGQDRTLVCEIDGGPRIGVVAFNAVEIDLTVGDVDGYLSRIKPLYDDCVKSNCDIIIAFTHWGWEYTTGPEDWTVELAHSLADMGFSMVVGSHAHVLQPMEYYNSVPIFYSLGNFCYGGNSNPTDKDSVIVQQIVSRDAEGKYSLGETKLIPCSISTTDELNDFCPTPYRDGGVEYYRVLSKLGVN